MTSRWVVDVAPARQVPVQWRTFSLALKSAGTEVPERFRALQEASLGALRVCEAARARHGDEAVGSLYTAVGRRFHLEDDKTVDGLPADLRQAGLDPDLAAAAGDAGWDEAIRESMAEATALVGPDLGVPILAFEDGWETFAIFGPVISPAPTGNDALRLWDQVLDLARSEHFFELKRPRTAPPQLRPPTA